ncbi:hypothetical protein M153_3190006724 [Pseudoloma neurophilia]|uniref:Uncharacterized protein n=1 Tax=Pseudoloma neurophilia TaxID=146866 RepID=A0A0R0M7B0_9MICR|nr:hypothetical protein M153_3190006724 [Pseudoloma neurophilia]
MNGKQQRTFWWNNLYHRPMFASPLDNQSNMGMVLLNYINFKVFIFILLMKNVLKTLFWKKLQTQGFWFDNVPFL